MSYNKINDFVNPFQSTVCGIGYFGVGKYDRDNLFYSTWNYILRRGSKVSTTYLTYREVTVCKEWHNFQVFAEWMENNYNSETMQGWHLDKDILFKGNKIYSPETCCFVPQEINQMFTKANSRRGKLPIGVSKTRGGKFQVNIQIRNKTKYLGTFNTIEEAFQKYKITKEFLIKEKANKWEDLISKECHQAMHNYQVEITD